MSEFKRKSYGNGGSDRPRSGYPKRDFGASSLHGPRKFTSGANLELFPATCASCGKPCQVPFRPNGKKPVYCKECFDANGGGDSAPRDFVPRARPSFTSDRKQESAGNGDIVELKKQMSIMNEKLDTLIELMAE